MTSNGRDSTVLVNTTKSPYSRLHPCPINGVQLEDGFWRSWTQVNKSITLPTQYEFLESTGRLDNFRRASGILQKEYQGYVFNDSDVYKWLESASWTLAYEEDAVLLSKINHVISLIIDAQDNDGYINTFFTRDQEKNRWQNLQDNHELYCAGHLIQAAIAHFRVTGEDKVISAAIRFADHLYQVFGPSKREGTGGHPEVEMALIELYRTTKEVKYLELAQLFINRRGKGILGGRKYLIDHMPFRKLRRLAGHAVRALYLCAGAADLYIETGETELLETLDRLWSTMVQEQIYLTGSLGSRHEGEAFGDPFELPNARAYAETCAAIASLMWNWRMLQLSGDPHYTDLFEWTLYNAVLPGISLDGKSYFYINPLRDFGNHRRSTWFDCACCPPNISRTIAMLPGYLYSLSPEGVWIHQYTGSHAHFTMENGDKIGLHQVTSYPWDGQITIEITSRELRISPKQGCFDTRLFSIFLRIPGWIGEAMVDIKVNSEPITDQIVSGAYLEITRDWKTGDIIDIRFPMDIHFIEAHPLLPENHERVAITRGPLVYCLESEDNPGLSLTEIHLNPKINPDCEILPDHLDGMVKLRFNATVKGIDPAWNNKLYRCFCDTSPNLISQEITAEAIPYYTWGNRKPGEMQIWNPR